MRSFNLAMIAESKTLCPMHGFLCLIIERNAALSIMPNKNVKINLIYNQSNRAMVATHNIWINQRINKSMSKRMGA